MNKRSYDDFNSKHIKEFEKKTRFKKMLKSNEFKCYNKNWVNNSVNFKEEKTYEEIIERINNARKIWNEKYEYEQYIKKLKVLYNSLYNESPKGCLAKDINWLNKKIKEKEIL